MHDQDIVKFIGRKNLSDSFRKTPLHVILKDLIAKEWIDYKNGIVNIKVSLYKQWVEKKFNLDVLIDDLFDFQEKAVEYLLEAQNVDDPMQSIQLLEKSLEHDPKNDEILKVYIDNLKKTIEFCLNTGNANLAKKYISKLYKYDKKLSRVYEEKARSSVNVELILQSAYLYTRDNKFLEALETIKGLEDYDRSLAQRHKGRVLYQQLSFVIKEWFKNILLGSAILISVIGLTQLSQPTSGGMAVLYVAIYLLSFLASAYAKSIRERIVYAISLAIPYIIGVILIYFGLKLIPDKDLVKTLFLLILLFLDICLVLAPTDSTTKGFGVMVSNIFIFFIFVTGGVVILPAEENTGPSLLEMIKNPPDNSNFVWENMVKFVEWLSKR